MKRRIILAGCLAAFVAGSAGAALADPGLTGDSKMHDVCIAVAQNDNYHTADYYCVTTP
jgi:hypothetical protein